MKIQKLLFTKQDVPALAQQLKGQVGTKQIFTIEGPLGAGKTTLIQELFKQLEITEPVVSPTYTYYTLYTLPGGQKLYHFDLYRLNSGTEFMESGFDEFLYQPNSYCFIEWPEIIEPLLKESVVAIKLEYAPDDKRLISVTLK